MDDTLVKTAKESLVPIFSIQTNVKKYVVIKFSKLNNNEVILNNLLVKFSDYH